MSQYATDENLRARQRLWARQDPEFDVGEWTLDVAGVKPAFRVLDVGCGNGRYLEVMGTIGVDAVGCDLSLGMLQGRPSMNVVAADAMALPFPSGHFDVVLAPHVLYHVVDRTSAIRECRRVLAAGGRFVAVTNGVGHLGSLRRAVDEAAVSIHPGWRWIDRVSEAFSLENGSSQLATVFGRIRCARPDPPGRAIVTDPEVISGYVASVRDMYGPDFIGSWDELVVEVRARAAAIIERDGMFVVEGDVGAFICT